MEKEILDLEQAASHYLLAAIGKKVLRPGGKELTNKLIEGIKIEPKDRIVEFAPGQGYTTNSVLQKHPQSYIGIDLDLDHVENLKKKITPVNGTAIKIIQGDCEATGLPDASEDKIFGEAMLSMHADQRKTRIIKEASRILKSGGLYAIHELELNLNGEAEEKQAQIQRDLALVSHVNARPLTIDEWTHLLNKEGFEVVDIQRRPLKVLDPSRIIADEGILQTLKIIYNVITKPKARKRVLKMRKTFKEYDDHLNAVAIIAKKK